MKNIKSYFVILLAITSLVGCKKFLERPPAGKLEEEKTLVHEDSLLQFLNGIYPLFAGDNLYGGKLQVLKELTADHINGVLLTEDNGEIWRRKTSIFGQYKNDFYRECYQAVYRANKVMQYLQYVSDAKKDRVEGEAKFIRGVMFFELVRLYAQPYGSTPDNSHNGIPIRLVADINPLGRSSVKDVYTQILADLNDAAAKLPENNGIYPSKFAAFAYLAKVYFQMNDFPKAYDFANRVMIKAQTAGSPFSFDDDVTKRFTLGESKEGIFFIKNEPGNYEPGKHLRDRFRSAADINPVMKFTQEITNLFTRPGDKRKDWFNTTFVPGFIVTTKYNSQTFDLPIVHVTEIKLIRAEAAGEMNQNLSIAVQDLRDILTRAGVNDDVLDGSPAASLIISIARREREEEMLAEGSRLDEIKRIGIRNNLNIDRRGSPYNCNGFILQFPDIEKAGNSEFINNAEGGCL